MFSIFADGGGAPKIDGQWWPYVAAYVAYT